jgi:hypothetical protein
LDRKLNQGPQTIGLIFRDVQASKRNACHPLEFNTKCGRAMQLG